MNFVGEAIQPRTQHSKREGRWGPDTEVPQAGPALPTYRRDEQRERSTSLVGATVTSIVPRWVVKSNMAPQNPRAICTFLWGDARMGHLKGS